MLYFAGSCSMTGHENLNHALVVSPPLTRFGLVRKRNRRRTCQERLSGFLGVDRHPGHVEVMGASVSGPLSGAALHPSLGVCISKDEVTRRLQRGMLDLQEAVDTAALTTSTAEVRSNRSQCEALAQEFRVVVTEIDGLVRVILQLLTEVDSDQLCDEAVLMSVGLFLASLEEIGRCIIMGTDFIAECTPLEVSCPGVDPNLATSWAVTLFQKISFCRTSFEVGFHRFLIELRVLGVLKSPVGWNISKDVAHEFCNCAPSDLFEWCVRSCRPVLKQLHLELGEEVVQHPHPGMDHLWLQLREARAERARCSLWTQVLDEPSAEPSDSLPLRVNYADVRAGQLLGQGSFGSVFECKWHDEDVAVKIIPLDVAAPEHQEKFQREVSILSSLRHPNIVRTFGYGLDTQGNGCGFILMEQMEMTLDKLIRGLRRDGGSHVFPLDVSMDLMSQILEGMCALRDGRVIHRDLKPGNILVNRLDNGKGLSERIYRVKLADFGTSKQHGVHTSIFTTMKVGTPSYMAPEVICALGTGKQGYSWEADVYSFGMVCSEILTGDRPFQHLSIVSCNNVLAAVRRGERPTLLLDREDPLRELIEDCWKLQPNDRPDVREIRRRLSQCRLRLFLMTQIPQKSNLFTLYQRQIISDQQQQISNLQEQHSDLQEKISDLPQENSVLAGMARTTTVVNKTTLAFKLKEGNGGVYKEVGTLAGLTTPSAEPSAANKTTLEFDSRSTYKEYLLESTASSIGIAFSVDVFEYATIYIVQDPINAQKYVIQRDNDALQEIDNDALQEIDNDVLQEIDNVLWMNGLKINFKNRCQEALRSWAEKDKLFTSRIDSKRIQRFDFLSEVGKLVGFYGVFQAVLFSTVVTSKHLDCSNTWTATPLSLMASSVTIIGVILKLRSIKELENTIASEEVSRRALVAWQLSLREEGENFNFDFVKAENQKNDPKKKRREKRSARWLKGSFLLLVVILTLFSVAFVVLPRLILCNPGRNPYP